MEPWLDKPASHSSQMSPKPHKCMHTQLHIPGKQSNRRRLGAWAWHENMNSKTYDWNNIAAFYPRKYCIYIWSSHFEPVLNI